MSLKWEFFKLKDLITLKTGKLDSNQEEINGTYPFFTCAPNPSRINSFAFNQKAILLAGNNANGNFHINYYEGKFNAYQRTYVINVLDAEKLNLKYPFYSLKICLNDLKRMSQGTSTRFLTKNILNNFEIGVPPMEIQKKIVDILDNLSDKIKVNKKINSNLLKISYKLYEEWFLNFEFPNEDNKPYKSSSGEFKETSLGIIPKKWNVGFLEDLINFQNGYAFKSKDLLKKEETNCFHVFKMGHILKGGGLNHQGTKNWIKKSDCENLSKFILKKGDLLMSMTDMKGNVAILGHTALMDENDKYIVNQRVGLLRVSNNYDINYPYLYLLTNHNKFLKNLRGRANSGVQVNLSTKEIKQSKVVIPSKEINQKFDNIIKPIFDMIFSNNQEIIKLNNLIDILLPKLMNGSINISSVRF